MSEIIVVLCFVYALQFSFFPLNATRIIILLLLAGIMLQKERVMFPYHDGTFRALIPMFLFLIYATLGTLFIGASNIEVFANMFLTLFQVGLGAYLITSFFFREDFGLDRLLFVLLLVFAMQGLLSLPNLLIPPYRDFMNDLFPVGGNIKEDMISSNYRVRGLMMGIGGAYSSHLSIGFLISAYFLSSPEFDKKDKRIVALCVPCILTGILFIGRTGLVMIPLAVSLYYLLLLLNGTFSIKKLLPLLWVPALAVGVYFLAKWVYFLAGGDTYLLGLWEKWAFGEFVGYLEGSNEQRHTLEILESHFFIPEDDTVLLFGNPKTWYSSFSDIGYIKYLFAGGIIGASLNYLGHACVYMQLIILSDTRQKRLLFLFLTIWMLIIEYKEPAMNNYLFTSTVMLMLFVSMRYQGGKEYKYGFSV